MTGLAAALSAVTLAWAMVQASTRPVPPTRDPHTPGYVSAKELLDDAVPPSDVDGNFIIGPTHNPAPEMVPLDERQHFRLDELRVAPRHRVVFEAALAALRVAAAVADRDADE